MLRAIWSRELRCGTNMKNESAYRTRIADELRRQGVEIEMTVEEAAVYLNVTPRLIYELVAADQIPVRKIKLPGRKRPILRFSRTALDRWRNECSDAAA
jgi:excisionase family DNA binding protein